MLVHTRVSVLDSAGFEQRESNEASRRIWQTGESSFGEHVDFEGCIAAGHQPR